MTPTSVYMSHDMPKVSITKRFVRERPPPSFPQIIKKEKRRVTFWKIHGDPEATLHQHSIDFIHITNSKPL